MTPTMPRRRSVPLTWAAAVAVLVTLGAVGGCGGASGVADPSAPPSAPASSSGAASSGTGGSAAPVPVESNPPGDIPDNLAFVPFASAAGKYRFTHPEGWAQTGSGSRVQFTDKLNGVSVDSAPATAAPTVATASAADVDRLRASVPAFELRDVSAASVPGGQAVRVVFRRNSEPDQVTGKVYRDEVEEYLVYRSGRRVRMDLYGPVGADNVDAYQTMAQSLSIS